MTSCVASLFRLEIFSLNLTASDELVEKIKQCKYAAYIVELTRNYSKTCREKTIKIK
jgi:hypothetical protein